MPEQMLDCHDIRPLLKQTSRVRMRNLCSVARCTPARLAARLRRRSISFRPIRFPLRVGNTQGACRGKLLRRGIKSGGIGMSRFLRDFGSLGLDVARDGVLSADCRFM